MPPSAPTTTLPLIIGGVARTRQGGMCRTYGISTVTLKNRWAAFVGHYWPTSPSNSAHSLQLVGFRIYPKSFRHRNRNAQAPNPNRATAETVPRPWTALNPPVAKQIPHVAKNFPQAASHECWRQNSAVLTHKPYQLDAISMV